MTLIIETQSYHTHCTLQELDIDDHLVSSLVSTSQFKIKLLILVIYIKSFSYIICTIIVSVVTMQVFSSVL